MGYFIYTNMINKPAKFRDKIPIIDIFILVGVFVLSIMVMVVISRVTGISKVYTMSFTLVIVGLAYRVLSVTSAKPHPSYLMSYIALHFLQPKIVRFASKQLAPFDPNRKKKFLADVKQIQGPIKPSGSTNKQG